MNHFGLTRRSSGLCKKPHRPLSWDVNRIISLDDNILLR